MKLAGILLLVVGILSLAYQGFSYTRTERVVDLGPVEINKETTKHVPLPPVLGGLALVGGIVLLIAGGRRRSDL